MGLEDDRSRWVEDARGAAEVLLREREALLRELYTPFVPIWVAEELDQSSADGAGNHDSLDNGKRQARGEGRNSNNGDGEHGVEGEKKVKAGMEKRRAACWWKGADPPLVWGGPTVQCGWISKKWPVARFVPHARPVLDGLDTQPVSVGRPSREFLNLLSLPHESVRDMYNQVRLGRLL